MLILNNYEYKYLDYKKPLFENVTKYDFIIKPFGAGLGDNLWHSHLPKIAKKLGYDRVLVSNMSDYRNNDYKYFIWELNPYVDGYCNDTPSFPYPHDKNKFCVENRDNNNINILDYIMLYAGLDDNERLHKPEIYYIPQKILTLNNSIIFDPNYVSDVRIKKENFKLISKYFSEHNIKIDYHLKPLSKESINSVQKDIKLDHFQGNIKFDSEEKFYLSCTKFQDFCDLIYTIKGIYCFSTGTIVLSEALNKKCCILMDEKPTKPIHSNFHSYILLQ